MRAYALDTADLDDEAVDMFLRQEDAEAALAYLLCDEPGSRELLSVVEIELDERDVSPN